MPSDGLWVKDWVGVHGSDEWANHRVCTETTTVVGSEHSKPLLSRRLKWQEQYQLGGMRMDAALRCWEATDCGGRLMGEKGAFVCGCCKARAH